MLAHYGVVALPCQVRDPDRKGKVEAGVAHAQKTPLKGVRFESLEEAQAHLDRWETRWADTRIHGTTKRQVAAMFAEEKPSLLPLPVEPFRYYQYGDRVVHLDGCVEVEAAYYGLPPGWIGRTVKVQWDTLHVRILDPETHQLLREHVGQKRGGYRVRPEDNPKKTPVDHRPIACTGGSCRISHRRNWPKPSIAARARPPSVVSWVCSPWPKNTVSRPSRMPRPLHSNSTSMITVSSAAIWSGGLH